MRVLWEKSPLRPAAGTAQSLSVPQADSRCVTGTNGPRREGIPSSRAPDIDLNPVLPGSPCAGAKSQGLSKETNNDRFHIWRVRRRLGAGQGACPTVTDGIKGVREYQEQADLGPASNFELHSRSIFLPVQLDVAETHHRGQSVPRIDGLTTKSNIGLIGSHAVIVVARSETTRQVHTGTRMGRNIH